MEWKAQYKHPNWQRKRLEALEASGFKCQRCGDTEMQIHVHHKRYVKGRMIWEYGIGELEVMCETCHEQTHAEKDALQGFIAKLSSEAVLEILGVVVGYCEERHGIAHVTPDDIQLEVISRDDMRAGLQAAVFANNGWKSS